MKKKEMREQSRAAFDELGATVRSLSSPVGDMSGGQRQAIAITRAVRWASRVVFLDEPTAALGVRQTENVLDTIRRVRDKGIAVVFTTTARTRVLTAWSHWLYVGRSSIVVNVGETASTDARS